MRALLISVALGGWLLPAMPASAQGSADGLQSVYPHQAMVGPDKLLRACCDFYCPKPQPCIPFYTSGCGVPYCPKPLPCIPCFTSGCSADCYCRKPCPDLCLPIAADFYHCAVKRAMCAKPSASDPAQPALPGETYASDSDFLAE
jgi:hypothetical protein